MNGEDAVTLVVKGLEELGVPYMLSGSFATNLYSIPRLTQDADFVVQATGRDIERISTRLAPVFGFDDQLSFETVTGTFRFEAWHEESGFHIEFFQLSDDEHDQERFARRKRAEFGYQPTFVPTVDDVIVSKLRWLKHAKRVKDREDLRSVIAVSGRAIDWDYIYAWSDRHDTRDLLEEIRATVPDL